jgi:stage III sporulation protein AH
MVIRGKSLLLSLAILLALGAGGYYLIDYYSNLQLAWDPKPTENGGPGLMPSGQPQISTEPTSDFFAEHRLEREKQRSMQVELLREIINNTNTSAEVRQQAQQDWLSLTGLMEKELTVEKLVMSKGFDDAILVFNNDVANVIVKSSALAPAEALQIAELVASSLGVNMQQVRVIEHA